MLRSIVAHLALLLVPALPLGAQSANVLIVDPDAGPGTDYTKLQDAIDAAGEGDLLLVRSGIHIGWIDGKSLVLQTEQPAAAILDGLVARNLTADQSLEVSGFSGGVMYLWDCAGPVRILEGNIDGIDARRCADLVLSGMQVTASTYGGHACEGGLNAFDSTVHVYGSNLRGDDPVVDPGLGFCFPGPGIFLSESSLNLQGSTVKGGREDFFYEFCASPGLRAVGASSAVIIDSEVEAGGPYFIPIPDCVGTVPDIEGVVPTYEPGSMRRIVSPSPVFEGQTTTVEVQGEPGDLVFLTVSTEPGLTRSFPAAGFFHGELAQSFAVPFGFIPASGTLSHDVWIPPFSGSDLFHSKHLQTFTLSAGWEVRLGAPALVHILDPIVGVGTVRAQVGPRRPDEGPAQR